jgi:hypothetical protein
MSLLSLLEAEKKEHRGRIRQGLEAFLGDIVVVLVVLQSQGYAQYEARNARLQSRQTRHFMRLSH